MADDIKLDPSPESTWAASADYKAAWHEKYGATSPSANASKEEWVKYASTTGGMTKEDAEAATRDDLIARYGANTLYVAPSAPNTTTASAGEGPEGNVAGDPTDKTATGTTGTAAGTTATR